MNARSPTFSWFGLNLPASRTYVGYAGAGEDEDAVVAYLDRLVVNEVRSRKRRRTTARRRAHLLDARPLCDPTAAQGDRAAVLAALGQLPARRREALVLRFWLDLPVQQIADAMGTRPGTVKSQLSRGMAAVESLLGRDVEVDR
ncbi:MAG: sigma factor-like helix-turn-helix DNA-binding protein [Nocardioidaceae bacterium]